MTGEKIMKTNIHTWPPKNSAVHNFQLSEKHTYAANGNSLLIELEANRHIKTVFSFILPDKPPKNIVAAVTVKKNTAFSADRFYFQKFPRNGIGVCL